MNNYISLDGYKYTTLQRSWRPATPKGSTARITLGGDLDVTYGALTLKTWTGEIRAEKVARAIGWGTISTLRTTLAKREALAFTDHYGDSYTVHQIGRPLENPIQPDWDNNSSVIDIAVQLVGT